MTIPDAFKMLEGPQMDSLQLSNEDGLNFIQYAMNKSALGMFKITINDTPGKTLIQKLTP